MVIDVVLRSLEKSLVEKHLWRRRIKFIYLELMEKNIRNPIRFPMREKSYMHDNGCLLLERSGARVESLFLRMRESLFISI